MIPNQVLLSTPIVIVSIVAIVAVYLLVLKRNGWIGRTSAEKSQVENIVEAKPELKIQKSTPIIIENKVAAPEEEIKQPEIKKIEPLTVVKEENKSTKKSKSKKIDKTKKDVPEGCNHHFGYLWTLPKGTATPDECYMCFKLIDCYKEAKEP